MKSDFYALAGLTKRGIKIFLKDKAGVFFSLLAHCTYVDPAAAPHIITRQTE